MTALEDAAKAFVDARIAQEGSDSQGWFAHALEVDGLWYELVILAGRCTCGVSVGD